jgi:hypothetical protein
VVALASGAISAVAGVILRIPPTPPAAAPSAGPSRSPEPRPVASEAPPFSHAIRYACTELAPGGESSNDADTSPALTLQRGARWYGVSALACADGLVLDQPEYEKIRAAIVSLVAAAPKDLSVLGRALTQNAAMRVARCARSKGASGVPSVPSPSIEELRRFALRLVQRFALTEAELTTLKELAQPAAEKWLGAKFDERAVDGPHDSIGIHARAKAMTLASRALPTDAEGVATLYGDLVLITERGIPRTAGVPAYVLRRRTSDAGLSVCFGALSENRKTGAPEMRPIGIPEGPLDLRGVTCARCHIGGRRLSEPLPQPRSDGPLIEDVTRWLESASDSGARSHVARTHF